ncbi:hypothetical protein ACYEXS_11770 [Paenibacillus sp. MAH-36]
MKFNGIHLTLNSLIIKTDGDAVVIIKKKIFLLDFYGKYHYLFK